jgi:hypothetical protein
MSTQVEKFKQIANAIREVEGRTDNYTIAANDFAEEITKLDPILKATDNFENGYYGLRAARCASTYLLARVLGTDKFVYHTNNIFSQVADHKPYVRLGEYARIDCSAFVGLCLRGIPYDKSPYASHKNIDEKWTPSQELADIYGTEGWEFKILDKQKADLFNNIGLTNKTDGIEYSTIRYAADLGRYFYKYGLVLYDKKMDGEIAGLSGIDLQPGDLVFWDTSDNINVDSRFKSISHVGLVAENINYYYQVTGTQPNSIEDIDSEKKVIFYTKFINSTNHPINKIALIVRPDYRPRVPKKETPIGVNLLEYPWRFTRSQTYSKLGFTFTLVDNHSFRINGTSEPAEGKTGVTFNIKGKASKSINDENADVNTDEDIIEDDEQPDNMTLSPGTYQLTGIDGGFSGPTFTLQVRNASGSDLGGRPVRFPAGKITIDNEEVDAYNSFELEEETDVIVRLYISKGKELTDTIVTPTLIRTK